MQGLPPNSNPYGKQGNLFSASSASKNGPVRISHQDQASIASQRGMPLPQHFMGQGLGRPPASSTRGPAVQNQNSVRGSKSQIRSLFGGNKSEQMPR